MSEAIPRDATIYVAGHRGLVGSAILRRLDSAGFTNILTVTRLQELGWQPGIPFEEGLRSTYAWFESEVPRAEPEATLTVD